MIDESEDMCHKPLVLILAPTREIAIQINGYVNLLLPEWPKLENIWSQAIIGGIPIKETKKNLILDKPKVIWGTLGRVVHWVDRNYISLDSLKLVILDEADQLCKQSLNKQSFEHYNSIK